MMQCRCQSERIAPCMDRKPISPRLQSNQCAAQSRTSMSVRNDTKKHDIMCTFATEKKKLRAPGNNPFHLVAGADKGTACAPQ